MYEILWNCFVLCDHSEHLQSKLTGQSGQHWVRKTLYHLSLSLYPQSQPCLQWLTKRTGQVSGSGLQRGKSSVDLDAFDSQILPDDGDDVLAMTQSPSPSPSPSPSRTPTVSTNFLKEVIAQSIMHLPQENRDVLKAFGAAAYGMGNDRSKLSVATLCSGTDGVIDTLKDRVPPKHIVLRLPVRYKLQSQFYRYSQYSHQSSLWLLILYCYYWCTDAG